MSKKDEEGQLTEEELAIQRGDVVDEEDEEEEGVAAAAAEDDDTAADDDGDGAAEGDELDAGADDKDKNIKIPKSRLDEVLAKSRETAAEYQRQIDELQSQIGNTRSSEDIVALRKHISEETDKYEEFVSDGKITEARAIRATLDVARERMMDMKASSIGDAARVAAVQELTYNQTLANFEGSFPVINADHDDFDRDVAVEVATLKNAFVDSGYAPAAALSKAVGYVLGKTPQNGVDTAATTAARNLKTRQTNAALEKKAPPNLSKTGKASDKGGADIEGLNPIGMSEAQFAKLTNDQLKTLRGDVL